MVLLHPRTLGSFPSPLTTRIAELILSIIVRMCRYLVFTSCSVPNIALHISKYTSIMYNPFFFSFSIYNDQIVVSISSCCLE
jgi:hypothetical protein